MFFFGPKQDQDQDKVMIGYNALRGFFPQEKSAPMRDGICGADVSAWMKNRLSENRLVPPINAKKRRGLALLAGMKPDDLKNYVAENLQIAKDLFEYGRQLQINHEGNIRVPNNEKKKFRQDAMSAWLFSLPLVAEDSAILQALQKLIKPDYLFRIYSERHVMGAHVVGDTIFVFDPNDEEGQKEFHLGDIKNFLKYIKKQFSMVGEKLDAISVFLPANNRNPELNPPIFTELKHYIRGNSNNSLFDSSLSVLINEIKDADIPPVNICVVKLQEKIHGFNNSLAVIDEGFIKGIVSALTDISLCLQDQEQFKDLRTRIGFYVKVFANFIEKKSTHVSIDYIVGSIGLVAMQQQDNLVHAEVINTIVMYVNFYKEGSLSLEEIISNLKKLIYSLVQSDEYFKDKYRWHYAQLEGFYKEWDGVSIKEGLLKLIMNKALILPKQRNNLHVAIAMSDSKSVLALLNAGYDPNMIYDDDKSPLHLAVGVSNLQLINLLIRSGGDVNWKYNSQTLMHYDTALSVPSIAKTILNADFSYESLHHKHKVEVNVVNTPIDFLRSGLKNKERAADTIEVVAHILDVQLLRKVISEEEQYEFLDWVLEKGDVCCFINFINTKSGLNFEKLKEFFSRAVNLLKIEAVECLLKYLDFTTVKNVNVTEKIYPSKHNLSFIDELLGLLRKKGSFPDNLAFLINEYRHEDRDFKEGIFLLLAKYEPDVNKIIKGKTIIEHAAKAGCTKFLEDNKMQIIDKDKYQELLMLAEGKSLAPSPLRVLI